MPLPKNNEFNTMTSAAYQAGLPLIGNTLRFQKDTLAFYQNTYQRYGEISRTYLLFGETYILLGPIANEFVLANRDQAFVNKQAWEAMIGRFFGGAVLMRDGDDHRFQRRLLSHAFTKSALQDYAEVMRAAIPQVVESWVTLQPQAIYPKVKQLTLDIAIEVFMGVKPGPQAAAINAWFCSMVDATVSIIRHPLPFSKCRKAVKNRQLMEAFFKSLIAEKKAKQEKDMFSHLVHAKDEEGNGFSDKEIIDHMIFMMMAAHDTTTSAISSVFEALSHAPEHQHALREALLHGSDAELMACTIKEALRLYPPLVTIPRATCKDIEFKGVHIPKNSYVDISPLFTHRMAEYWPNPETFDPERFRDGHPLPHRYAWIPFGGGMHKCLGMKFAEMQIEIVLECLLPHYCIAPAAHRRDKPKKYVPILKAADNLPLIIEKRYSGS